MGYRQELQSTIYSRLVSGSLVSCVHMLSQLKDASTRDRTFCMILPSAGDISFSPAIELQLNMLTHWLLFSQLFVLLQTYQTSLCVVLQVQFVKYSRPGRHVFWFGLAGSRILKERCCSMVIWHDVCPTGRKKVACKKKKKRACSAHATYS